MTSTYYTNQTDMELQYIASGQIIVGAGVYIVDSTDPGFSDAQYNNSSLTNYGDIQGYSYDGIRFTADYCSVFNGASGVISASGDAYGIDIEGNRASVTNLGVVQGDQVGIFISSNYYPSLNNSGTVSSLEQGVFLSTTGGDFVNSGDIQGSAVGLQLDTIYSSFTSIIANSGVIRGAEYSLSIFASDIANGNYVTINNTGTLDGTVDIGENTLAFRNSGNVFGDLNLNITAGNLQNYGTIEGNVAFDNGGETVVNVGSIFGDVTLGSSMSSVAATFDGGRGSVSGTIYGTSSDDTIRAGADGERIAGGAGHDRLFGGAGADTFVFSSFAAADSDRIFNFNASNDTIELAHSVFTTLAADVAPVFAIGAAATRATDHLFYNSTTGGLFYDTNGSAAGGAFLVATLNPKLALTANNFSVV